LREKLLRERLLRKRERLVWVRLPVESVPGEAGRHWPGPAALESAYPRPTLPFPA
jgi:hypothetical protein